MNLKPCPNCGTPNPMLKKKKYKYYYSCGECWTDTHKHLTVEEAAAEWNFMESERCYEECNYD